MAPTRKSRSINKRFSYPNEISPVKDGDGPKRSNKRKRKLSDMLGPQWSKEELQRFYEAYRKYGKDWKKVAAALRNRSVEMVEALYTMNRAYLSLPEGTASVVGLIAMMTDHYSILEGSDSEQESNDGIAVSRRPQKRSFGKLQPNATRRTERHFPDVSQSQSVESSYGCLSLLKKRRSSGNQPRAVGKRTPRVPVKYTYDRDNGERYFSPARPGQKQKGDTADEDVAHEVALALAEASHRGGSPQISQTPNKRRENVVSSPAGFGERMCSESEISSAKNIGDEVDDDGCEGSLGSTEGDNDIPKGRSYSVDKKGVGIMVQQKLKNSIEKKMDVDDAGHHTVDETREACSGTEEGQKISGFRGKFRTEVADAPASRSSGQAPKKRSKKVLFGRDEGEAFDALQTLADLSLMMPATTADTEPTTPVKEEKDSDIDKFSPREATPASNQRDKKKASVYKKRGDRSVVGAQVSEVKISKRGKLSVPDSSPVPELKDTGTRRRKQKSQALQVSEPEVQMDSDASDVQKKEFLDQGKKTVNKSRRSPHIASQPQMGRLVRISEHSSSSTDLKRDRDDSNMSSIQALATNQAKSPMRVRSRRKLDKSLIERNSKDLKISESLVNDRSIIGQSYHERSLSLKEKISNCLSNCRARRWCIYEWFYSATDYPWFAKSEFVEYLYHVGLGHIPRLTRVEWGVIRSSLGKPRRFSAQFLNEEREKLNYYRESVRNHYAELRTGKREGLPTDLARPLTVGQRVVAIHPRTRELHNGSVLTVDDDKFRVQFDRPELGVEFVMDIDCMPLNPSENVPAALKSHNVAAEKFYEALKQLNVNEGSEDRKKEEYIKFGPCQRVETTDVSQYVASTYLMSNSLKQVKEGLPCLSSHAKVGHDEVVSPQQAVTSQQSIMAQMQAKEADIRALSELTRALDKKNALVTELKRMNDDVTEDSSLRDVDSFKKQYAAVLVQLDEVFEQVSSALIGLRQRNTYQGNPPIPWQKPMASIEDRGNLISLFDHVPHDSQEAGSLVPEIVDSSRVKAQKMVDAAIQAISSLKDGADWVEKTEEAIDHVYSRLSINDDSGMPVQVNQVNGIAICHNQFAPSTSNLVASDHLRDSKSNGASDERDPQVPSELIANCVATLLMIQKCTERQFPPADVAQVLDVALTSLQPCCPQNLPIYAEIQKCMGIIRSQILALIPT